MSKQHPDDIIAEAASIAQAADHIEAWLGRDDHRDAIIALVLTYSDASAEKLLAALREDFWAGLSS